MSKTIVFFGNERLATGVSTEAPALTALIAAGYEVAALVVAQNEGGRSRRPRPLEVAEVARQHGIPMMAPDDLGSETVRNDLAACGAQAAVLIAYGKIVPPSVLEVFPAGIINVHPSLLPLHRGSTPIEAAILDGLGEALDKSLDEGAETGVSLMKLIEKMDAGPLYEQIKLPLAGSDTKQELADKLSALGTELLLKHLPGILDGSGAGVTTPVPLPQDDAGATFDPHIKKADGLIDWAKPAARLEREIQAYAGWPRSRTALGMTNVIITAAHVAEGAEGSGANRSAGYGEADNGADKPDTLPGNLRIEGKQLSVYCGQGLLIIDKLIPEGKREMPAEAFLAGYS